MEEYFDDVELENLYQWIDRIPLTRPKKNIAKDFADAGIFLYLIFSLADFESKHLVYFEINWNKVLHFGWNIEMFSCEGTWNDFHLNTIFETMPTPLFPWIFQRFYPRLHLFNLLFVDLI